MPVCLSVQSLVVSGAVGQGAAAFVLAAEGVEVWPLPTVILSGHAATAGVEGRRLPGEEIAALARGLGAAGALSRVDAVLTGYLGTPEAALAVADLVAAVKRARPDAVYLCDPVLGDAGRLYLPEAMIGIYRDRLLPLADIATPNLDELGWLIGAPAPVDVEGAALFAQRLRGLGPDVVHATSVPGPTPHQIGILACDAGGSHACLAPRAPLHLHGAGDFTAALLLACALGGDTPREAADRVAPAVARLAARALDEGRSDLPVVGARAVWQG
ncbi:pyridoxal kinase [Halovulum dunhuangense]|uniref:pyridoxal kinase n=1 Tax=Halovulum dunhuangense TaxID=1505036 RepID=A0A849L3E4_9RHOB|nr:pyridoxal kinase [Halovulum dunhuangense]NNU80839.1 pyridoxal kinase [Halovulum dunhuangense]